MWPDRSVTYVPGRTPGYHRVRAQIPQLQFMIFIPARFGPEQYLPFGAAQFPQSRSQIGLRRALLEFKWKALRLCT